MDDAKAGRLADNIAHFARALRRAGLRLGPGQVLGAVHAVEAAGFTDRRDFYWVLHACLVTRPEERAVFAQVFRLFWRDPRYLEQMMSLLLPSLAGVQEQRRAEAAERRAAEALLDGAGPEVPKATPAEDLRIDFDASGTASAEERLRTLDFELMSVEEIAAARRMIAALALPARPLPMRRSRADARGRIADWRATMSRALRRGGEVQALAFRRRRERWPDLVILCDISGSMSDYSRMILHFAHAAANWRGKGWGRVHAFTFGTRLTNITRHLARRDVDAALAAAGAEAQDWRGGTRIGQCLHAFNRDWSRRVLGQGAVVVLVTDGLERDAPETLAGEIERLHLSCRRLIWVNPLLRWDGFAPRARGVQVILPHVDSMHGGHSVSSLEALARALATPDDRGARDRLRALLPLVAARDPSHIGGGVNHD
jgi:uncharacterized protein with von Willebrand factor type A (vWA) domain